MPATLGREQPVRLALGQGPRALALGYKATWPLAFEVPSQMISSHSRMPDSGTSGTPWVSWDASFRRGDPCLQMPAAEVDGGWGGTRPEVG